jgi:hypothetical protein
MQDPFGPQRDPHRDWVNRMEKGAAYEQWKKGRGQGGVGQVIAWIVFLGFVLLIILFIMNAQ